MKVKLLKRLRRRARNLVHIHSVTRTNGVITGMSYGFTGDEYRGLFGFGDTEEDVMKKAEHIYIQKYLNEQI